MQKENLNDVAIGYIVKSVRKNNTPWLGREEMAELLQVSTRRLVKIETGKSRISKKEFERFLILFGISREDFDNEYSCYIRSLKAGHDLSICHLWHIKLTKNPTSFITSTKMEKTCAWCGNTFAVHSKHERVCGKCYLLPYAPDSTEHKHYVYLIKDQDDHVIYVGKGTIYENYGYIPRMYQHEIDAIRTLKDSPIINKLREMINAGEHIKYEIVSFFKDNDDALDSESSHIQEHYDAGYLINKNVGLQKKYTSPDGTISIQIYVSREAAPEVIRRTFVQYHKLLREVEAIQKLT